ncbi:MAG: hypothetical protein C4576_30435 [Desulfobacteraceae bacterium]|nr:MAG: hypothetical protein C4576_30435 [Desulfobacteraceae bacterium]
MGRRILFIGNLILTAIFFACTPLSSDYRAQGFKYTQRAFDYYEETPGLHKVIELERIRIHIVGSRKQFEWKKARAEGSSTLAYATKDEIYLFGKQVGNKIIVNQAVLGHELNHLLNFKDIEIADPDALDELESRHHSEIWSQRIHKYFKED